MILLLLACVQGQAAGTLAAFEAEDDTTNVLVVGAQARNLDAPGGRGARFERHRVVPKGLVFDSVRWSGATKALDSYLQITGQNLYRGDEGLKLRGGLEGIIRFAFGWQRIPYRIGDGAVSPLRNVAANQLRISDSLQALLERTPSPAIPSAISNLLGSEPTRSIFVQRERGTFSANLMPIENLNVEVAARHDKRFGNRPLGTGIYLRHLIRDARGTPVDYWFTLRGIEVIAPVDYTTTSVNLGSSYSRESWFGRVGVEYSQFENAVASLTYDNPFWYNSVHAVVSAQRGLWREGRFALPPDNRAWHLTFSGGVNLPLSTRATASVALGEHRQNEQFVPLVANTALIGKFDLNGDGKLDVTAGGPDDPTTAASLPRQNLNGKVRTAVIDILASSRPVEQVTVNLRFRSYEYDSQHRSILFPYFGDYQEATLARDFGSAAIIAWPFDLKRTTYTGEVVFRPLKRFNASITGELGNVKRDQYFDATGDTHKDGGTRAVKKTNVAAVGLNVNVAPSDWLTARASYKYATQDFSGNYLPAYRGEFQGLRQFDIAKRDRNSFAVRLNGVLNEKLNVGMNALYSSDDYPDSEDGIKKGKAWSAGTDGSYEASDKVQLYTFLSLDQARTNMQMRTKLSGHPAGPWNVPGFIWTTEYSDNTATAGAGVRWAITPGKHLLDLRGSYARGKIVQKNRNVGTPISRVGTASDFPDQVSRILSVEARYEWKITARYSVGIFYLLEDFSLDDFQWDVLQPYAQAFLKFDDSVRYLFLDSRYSSYTANVARLFVRVSL